MKSPAIAHPLTDAPPRACYTSRVNIIDVQSVTKTYPIGGRTLRVLDDVSFGVQAGDFVVIEGSSGSGKSTLLSLISGLDTPTKGRILVDGEDITDKTEDELAPMRNRTIGFVFQSFHLAPSLNARENIMFPAELARNGFSRNGSPGQQTPRQQADALLDRVGLAARATNFPNQLSGGEKQRVAICRALINDPKIVFADEPTGNLDTKNGDAILDLLLELHAERRTTLIMVTHEPRIAEMAERVITLEDGKIVNDR